MNAQSGRVVVAYDGSQPADAAVEWAAAEASRRRVPLTVLYVGRGELTGAVPGSVALTVTAHAACPVIVVRGDATPAGPVRPVVVGVDAWPQAASAVDFAAAVAASSSAPLVIVSAYRSRLVELDKPEDLWRLEYDGQPWVEDVARQSGEATAGAALLHVRDAYPDLDVSARVAEGPPARVLADIGAGAGLVVVGACGAGGFAALRLGSVTHALVHRAPCPVAVVPSPSSG